MTMLDSTRRSPLTLPSSKAEMVSQPITTSTPATFQVLLSCTKTGPPLFPGAETISAALLIWPVAR